MKAFCHHSGGEEPSLPESPERGATCGWRQRWLTWLPCTPATGPIHARLAQGIGNPVLTESDGIVAPKYYDLRGVHSRNGER